jgi:hypothetical protein
MQSLATWSAQENGSMSPQWQHQPHPLVSAAMVLRIIRTMAGTGMKCGRAKALTFAMSVTSTTKKLVRPNPLIKKSSETGRGSNAKQNKRPLLILLHAFQMWHCDSSRGVVPIDQSTTMLDHRLAMPKIATEVTAEKKLKPMKKIWAPLW